ncbi:MAG TPA: UvrD-helicase domain-containing protein, partial [Gemmataceae bacterium]|nr:UvrD-helicase domain-containing protein [Gemmataceae bacterium]
TAAKSRPASNRRFQPSRPATRSGPLQTRENGLFLARDQHIPHVMTFHALAYALVHPEESLLYNEQAENNQSLSRAVQWVIDDQLQSADMKAKIRELMLAHFREDWEQIVAGGYERKKEELLQIRRSLPRESLRGEYVKSFGEKVIADLLFEHNINYLYERNHRWGNINYRPDFTISTREDSGVVIEYFGRTGDPDYDERSQQKRNYWGRKPKWSFLEFGPLDINQAGVESFKQRLKSTLEGLGIVCKRLSEDEIWHHVRERAIDRFTKATETFIGRCRKLWLMPDALANLIERHTPLSPLEGGFLRLAHRLYVEYLNRLLATHEDDFDGLMQRAVQTVANGNTVFERGDGWGDLKRIRHVLIDEYQDFSELFFRLVDAIRKQNPHAQFFCVGDDWQAINGFAGSDLRFYESFGNYFAPSERFYLLTNYRSSTSVVDIGNSLMEGLGKPAVPHKKALGHVFLADLSEFEPSVLEKERHPGDDITPVILRLANKAVSADRDIVLLSRRNSLPWFVNYKDRGTGRKAGLEKYLDLLRSYLPKGQRERLTISTAHKYKGLQRSVVVVLDAVARSYPLIHPDWVFSRVLGDTVEKIMAEERRLFYVAATRAEDTLVLITEQNVVSPFLQEVQSRTKVTKIDWTRFPPILCVTSRLVVKVGNQDSTVADATLAIKDHLKAEGFRWHSAGWRAWTKSFATADFSIDTLQKSPWGRSANGVEVRLCDEQDEVRARWLVDAGQWRCVLDRLADTRDNEPDMGLTAGM